MNRKQASELEKLLAETRRKIAGVRLDVPELDAVAPAPRPAHGEKREQAAQRRRLRRAEWLLILLALALLGWLGLLVSGIGLPSAHRQVQLPMPSAVGLTHFQGRLYTLDPARQLLVTLSLDGQVQSVTRFDEPDATGIAVSPDGIWTSSKGGRITLRSAELPHPVLKSFANPARTPYGVTWDGILLWVSDPQLESVYQYVPRQELVPVRELPLPGLKAADIFRGYQFLWILDGPTRSIHRFRVGPMPRPVDQLQLGSWLAPHAKVVSMAVDDDTLWVLTEPPVTLHAFPRNRLRWRAAPRPYSVP